MSKEGVNRRNRRTISTSKANAPRNLVNSELNKILLTEGGIRVLVLMSDFAYKSTLVQENHTLWVVTMYRMVNNVRHFGVTTLLRNVSNLLPADTISISISTAVTASSLG